MTPVNNAKLSRFLKVYLMVCVIALAFTQVGYAARWAGIKGTNIFIDIDSLKGKTVNGHKVFHVWTKYKGVTGEKRKSQLITESLEYSEIVCENSNIAKLIEVFYGKNGEIETVHHDKPYFEPVIPDTFGDIMVSAICKLDHEDNTP